MLRKSTILSWKLEVGVAVIVLSSEAQEIIRVCDRTVVMFHGSVQGELVGDE